MHIYHQQLRRIIRMKTQRPLCTPLPAASITRDPVTDRQRKGIEKEEEEVYRVTRLSKNNPNPVLLKRTNEQKRR